jgi:hypothetical protein
MPGSLHQRMGYDRLWVARDKTVAAIAPFVSI